MKKIKIRIAFLTLISSIIYNCIEPVTITTNSFEDTLVVEATITCELKFQKINLSRTFELNGNNLIVESNADVKVIEENGDTYNFEENAPGEYLSTSQFAAKPNTPYQLIVLTTNGKEYRASTTMISSAAEIESINFIKELSDNGDLGVSVYLNSFDPSGNSRYYRYEFEETYKFIAPFWSRLKISVASPTEVEFTDNNDENQICYSNRFSSGILQTETTGLSEDRVTQELVHFLKVDDYAISERYSILIKQFVQSPQAFTFYKTLKELSSSESVLSENQPGFVKGNIQPVNASNEKVIGFFEISSVSQKRGFFNWRDVFSGEQRRPSYIIEDCELIAPQFNSNNTELIDVLNEGDFIYYRENYIMGDDPVIPNGGPYVLVRPECGDCTTLGSNIPPDFWEE